MRTQQYDCFAHLVCLDPNICERQLDNPSLHDLVLSVEICQFYACWAESRDGHIAELHSYRRVGRFGPSSNTTEVHDSRTPQAHCMAKGQEHNGLAMAQYSDGIYRCQPHYLLRHCFHPTCSRKRGPGSFSENHFNGPTVVCLLDGPSRGQE